MTPSWRLSPPPRAPLRRHTRGRPTKQASWPGKLSSPPQKSRRDAGNSLSDPTGLPNARNRFASGRSPARRQPESFRLVTGSTHRSPRATSPTPPSEYAVGAPSSAEISRRLEETRTVIDQAGRDLETLNGQLQAEVDVPARQLVLKLSAAEQRLNDLAALLGMPSAPARPSGSLADNAVWARELRAATDAHARAGASSAHDASAAARRGERGHLRGSGGGRRC